MVNLLHFNLGTGGYPANLLTSLLPLSTTEPLSYLSFEEAFQKAQEAYLPYYSVVIVQSGNNGEKKYYHAYDAIYFSVYSLSHKDPLTDPCTRRPVQRIHYFAIRCFKWDEEFICRPVNLGVDTPCIILINPKKFKSLLLDSTNANVFVVGKEQAQHQVRTTQYLIANYIEKGEIFRKLTDSRRQQEAMQWLWCSSHGSYQGLIQLVKQCLKSHPKASKIALKLLSEKLTSPSNKGKLPKAERLAVMEGFHLLENYQQTQKMWKNESKEM